MSANDNIHSVVSTLGLRVLTKIRKKGYFLMEQELDERKKKILAAVIKNYLDTGEPVGSRTISKYTDLSLSPATIRNEMADLEDMGYIFQPHTSAGRIPTDKGYRVYVDDMLESRSKDLDKREKKLDAERDDIDQRFDKIEEVLKDIAKILANNTNYTSMVSMPKGGTHRLKFVQITMMEGRKVLCTVVLEGNIVRNELIKIDEDLDQEAVLKLNILFNNTLNGLTLDEINFSMAAKLASQAKEHSAAATSILNAIVSAIGSEDGLEIFTSGATNIFKYPELSDKSKASEIISTLEEKELLGTLLQEGDDEGSNTTGIQVYIGKENAVSSMEDCAVVTATYEFDEGVYGKIGILGPKRMDYEKVVDALKDVTDKLDAKFEFRSQTEEKEEKKDDDS